MKDLLGRPFAVGQKIGKASGEGWIEIREVVEVTDTTVYIAGRCKQRKRSPLNYPERVVILEGFVEPTR